MCDAHHRPFIYLRNVCEGRGNRDIIRGRVQRTAGAK